jgi:hypothetical protein
VFSRAALGKNQDTAPPVIQHTPLSTVSPGKVTIDFTVSDESELFSVILHWRYAGEKEYKQVEFPTKDSTFFFTLTDVDRDFEFWIEAYDEFGNGPGLDGTADHPNLVRVLHAAPTPEPTPEPEPIIAPTPPPVLPPAPPPPEAEPPFPPGPFIADRVNRVEAARNLPAKRFELRLEGAYFFGTNFIYPDTSLNGGAGQIHLSFSPTDWIGLHVGTSFSYSNLSTQAANASSGFPLSASSLDDIVLSARLAIPRALGPLRLALEPVLGIPASNWCSAVSPVTGLTGTKCALSNFVVSPGVTGLVSIDTPHFRAHVNVGYLWDNSGNVAYRSGTGGQVSNRPTSFDTFALGLSAYDDLSIGVAAEVQAGVVVPYVEWKLDIPVDREHFATCTSSGGKTCAPLPAEFPAALWQVPDRIGAGLRFDLNSRMRLDVGFEASLTEASTRLVPAENAATSTPTKTAEPLGLPGVVLPPPFLLRIAYAFQFDAVRAHPKAEPFPGDTAPAGVPAAAAATPANNTPAPAPQPPAAAPEVHP